MSQALGTPSIHPGIFSAPEVLLYKLLSGVLSVRLPGHTYCLAVQTRGENLRFDWTLRQKL